MSEAKEPREKRGLQDGNSRASTIARWLAVPIGNADVTELVLTAHRPEENPTILGRWPRKDVNRELAPHLDALIQECAEDEEGTIKARLYFVLANGEEWVGKPFRAYPKRKESRAEHLDGSMLAGLQQSQKHAEIYMQKLVETVDRGDSRFEKVLDIMDRQLERMSERLERALDERDQFEDAAGEAANIAEEAATTAQTAVEEAEKARAEKDDKIGTVVDLFAEKLLPKGTPAQ